MPLWVWLIIAVLAVTGIALRNRLALPDYEEHAMFWSLVLFLVRAGAALLEGGSLGWIFLAAVAVTVLGLLYARRRAERDRANVQDILHGDRRR